MTLLFDRTTGLERLEREAVLILSEQLNIELASQEVTWAPLDLDFQQRMGREITSYPLEQIPNNNLHYGHKPSLIRMELEQIPFVAILAYSSEPGGGLDIDTGHAVIDTMSIEVMVKAGPYNRDYLDPGEELVNRRMKRTVDAIYAIFNQRPGKTLNGLVLDMSDPPTVAISNVFVRTESAKGYGGEYLFQGCRMEYDLGIAVNAA